MQSDTKLGHRRDFYPRTPRSTNPKISDDSVSTLILLKVCIVGEPQLQPRKDYDDYSRFINDTYSEEKHDMLNYTVSSLNRTGGFKSMGYNPLNTLRTYSQEPKNMVNKRIIKGRNYSVCGPMNETERKLGSTM
jgi:hypothetical protein